MDTNNVLGKFGFMRSFFYDQYLKVVSHIVTKIVTQIGATVKDQRYRLQT